MSERIISFRIASMYCFLCHGHDIRVSQVNEEFRLSDDIVLLSIQTPVCQTCGERYYDRRTIRSLEEFETKLRAGTVDLHEVGKVLTSG